MLRSGCGRLGGARLQPASKILGRCRDSDDSQWRWLLDRGQYLRPAPMYAPIPAVAGPGARSVTESSVSMFPTNAGSLVRQPRARLRRRRIHELMIVVAVIAILAAVAYPSYVEQGSQVASRPGEGGSCRVRPAGRALAYDQQHLCQLPVQRRRCEQSRTRRRHGALCGDEAQAAQGRSLTATPQGDQARTSAAPCPSIKPA